MTVVQLILRKLESNKCKSKQKQTKINFKLQNIQKSERLSRRFYVCTHTVIQAKYKYCCTLAREKKYLKKQTDGLTCLKETNQSDTCQNEWMSLKASLFLDATDCRITIRNAHAKSLVKLLLSFWSVF